jgi:MFS family permease
MSAPVHRLPNQFSLSIFWFAWEVHWAALLGAAMQAQVARFVAPGATGTATAILSGTGALFSILAQYTAGAASDRARKRMPFIIAGTLCNVAALVGFALAPSFVTVVAAFVAVQVCLNVAGGPYQALIPDHVPIAKLGSASAIMALFRLAGNAVGLLAARLLVVQPGPGVAEAKLTHGLLMLALTLSAILIGALAITVLGVKDGPSMQRPLSPAAQPVAWRERSSFVWLVGSRWFVSMGLYLILPFFAFYLRFALHVGAYLHVNLDLLLAMVGWALVGTVPAFVFGDRLSKKGMMFGALALLAGGSVALALVGSTSPLFAIAGVVGVGWGAYYAVDWALACSLLPERAAGATMALWNIGASGPQVLSPLIGGILADRIGAAQSDLGAGYRTLFAIVAAYVVLGAAALVAVREPIAEKGKAREAD